MIKTKLKKENSVLEVILSNNPINSISIDMLKELYKALDDSNLDKRSCILFTSDQKHFR